MKPELSTAKHQVLLATMLLLVPLALCQIYGIAVMRQSLAFRDPAMPQVADFSVSMPIALVLIAVRAATLQASQPVARAVLLPGKRDCAFRVERFSTALFKCFYFTAVTGFGYYVMKDEKWFPTSLGGSGDFLESLRVFREPPPPALTLYMATQFAFQLHNLLFVLLLKAIDSSTMEIVAHDLIAMLLISAAHLTNYTAGGAIVAFINDASDIFLHPFFMATASGRKAIVAPLLATLVVSWAYLRLLVFPRDGLYNYIVVSPRENPDMSMFFLHPLNTLFTLLVGLHVYWLVAFTRKGLDELRRAPVDAQLRSKPPMETR